MTRPKIEDERAGPPPSGGVDLSTVRGMEELAVDRKSVV